MRGLSSRAGRESKPKNRARRGLGRRVVLIKAEVEIMALIGVQVIKPRIENWTDKISYMGKSRTTQTRHGFSKISTKKTALAHSKKNGRETFCPPPARKTGPPL